MPYCPECGAEVADDQMFCQDCGENLAENEVVQRSGQTLSKQTTSSSSSDEVTVAVPDSISSHTAAFDQFSTGEKLVFVGAALTTLGAFLPWVTVFGTSVAGVQGDGVLTLILGLIAAGLLWWRSWNRRIQLGTLTVGSLIVLITLSAMSRAAGFGLYLTLAGGLVLMYTGARSLLDDSSNVENDTYS